jgi:hypothetical protein
MGSVFSWFAGIPGDFRRRYVRVELIHSRAAFPVPVRARNTAECRRIRVVLLHSRLEPNRASSHELKSRPTPANDSFLIRSRLGNRLLNLLHSSVDDHAPGSRFLLSCRTSKNAANRAPNQPAPNRTATTIHHPFLSGFSCEPLVKGPQASMTQVLRAKE